MSLQFCPVCRGLLNIQEIKGKIWSVCNCGFRRPSAIDISSVEISKNKNLGSGIIENDDFKENIEKLSYEDKRST